MSVGIPAPNPNYIEPIKNVTGNANVKIQNKNLAWNGWAEDFVNRVNNSNIASITTEDNRNCLFYKNTIGATMIFNQDWKANTQYTFSFYIKANYSPNLMIEYTDGTTTQINRSLITINSWSKIEVTSNANKTVKYLKGINEGGNDYIDLDTFMVEQGTTATSYVEHQEQNYPLTLGDIELCKIDTAQDYIYKENGKWYLHKEIESGVIPEYTRNLNTYTNGLKYATFNLEKIGIDTTSSNTTILCEKAKGEASHLENTICVRLNGTGFAVFGSADDTVETFNNKFSGAKYKYILQKAENIKITDTTLISQLEAILQAISYYEQTNISGSSDELSPIITASAVGDLNLILNN